jgi:hypothetical protein
VCIDLHALEGRRDLHSLKLALIGPALSVTDAERTPLVSVNTESFDVTTASLVAKPKHARATATNDAPTGKLIAGATLAAALLTAWVARRPRKTQRKAGKTQEI